MSFDGDNQPEQAAGSMRKAIRAAWRMSLRHAAALALVGWYLMVPQSTLPANVAYKRPLSTWQTIQAFDTAEECQDYLSTFFQRSREKAALNMLEPAYRDFMFAQCVASDDPRLKAK
jgi:hypothetical protein